MHTQRLRKTGLKLLAMGIVGASIWPAAHLSALASPAAVVEASQTSGSSAGSSLSSPKISMDEAESKAKSLFAIPDDYVLQNRSYSDAPGTGEPAQYQFTWQPSLPGQARTINVSIDADTGAVVNFNQPPQQERFIYPVPITADQAKAIAQTWVKKLYPDRMSEVRMQPLQSTYGTLLGATTYTYNFVRVVHGILAPFDGMSVVIGQNGELVSVNSHWTAGTFPDPSKAIPKSQADARYRDVLQLHLEYSQIYHPNGPADNVLLYVTQPASLLGWPGQTFSNQRIGGWPVIQAFTGQLVDASGWTVTAKPYTAPKPVVPGGPTLEPSFPKVNWSQQMSLDFARQALGIPSTDRLQSVYQWQPAEGVTTWNFTWRSPDGRSITATVDATHGLLTQFTQYTATPRDPARTPSVSQAKIDDAVAAFVKRVFARNLGAVAIVPMSVPKSANPALQTDFQVLLLVHGIPDQARSGNLQVDPATGTIQSFWMNSPATDDAANLPDPARAIPAAQAQQAWLTQRPLSLVYLLTQPAMAAKMEAAQTGKLPAPSPSDAQPEVILAYTPLVDITSNDLFNAITGRFEPPQAPVPYSGPLTDLDGVPGQDQIRLLVARQLIPVDAGGEVHPSQPMTSGAFIKLLVDALGDQYRYDAAGASTQEAMRVLAKVPKGSPQYQEIAVAYELGWLPQGQPFDPDAPISRTAAAILLAHALGYGPLLAHPDLFQLKVSDADTLSGDARAAAAIAVSLGMLPPSSGRFQGEGPVTLSDAAIAVVQAATLVQPQTGVRPLGAAQAP
ncbi:YcdB/YcdC domain-containing protein [Alicyclobacillus sp.]|uniref:YcdB/YcdC domain-containing protein n=1 Tax=Alicyclobacillus sp. TaxID=61169 RepID=UPI0025B91254|nr:YcdB/YcdC domain-containing protein [Alicyclobacillus sp.]MCL6516916.1 DUF4901 domain-containing protein [Alicyclobacillus sp.]